MLTGIVYAQRDPLLDMYTGTSNTPVIIEGPIFLDGGLYHFKVRILTLDSDTLVLPSDQQTLYDDWLSIGNSENKTISIGDKQVPVGIISYYDKLRDFRFDNKAMQMQFDMPFDWNMSRLNKTNIFVHQEISIPKPNDFTAKGSYSGTVNGIDISKNIMLDKSKPDKDIIHVMMAKDKVIQIAGKVNKDGVEASSDLMKFTLEPGGIGSMASSMVSMDSMGSMPSNGNSK
jgi:hypothetical protein